MADRSTIRRVTVSNPAGLHARPAHALVTLAQRYQAEIEVIRNGEAVDGKSILSVLTLAAEQGTPLTLKATGSDANEALDALEALFRSGFGEAVGKGGATVNEEMAVEDSEHGPSGEEGTQDGQE